MKICTNVQPLMINQNRITIKPQINASLNNQISFGASTIKITEKFGESKFEAVSRIISCLFGEKTTDLMKGSPLMAITKITDRKGNIRKVIENQVETGASFAEIHGKNGELVKTIYREENADGVEQTITELNRKKPELALITCKIRGRTVDQEVEQNPEFRPRLS